MKTILLSFALFLALSAPAPAASFWCTQFGLGCPAPAGFVPAYVSPAPTLNDGFGHTYALNAFYFATQVTATSICQLLFTPSAVDSCIGTYTQPCEMGGGSATCSAPEIWLIFKSGLKENAGLLAANYTRNPESLYPGVALKLINTQLALDQQSQGVTPSLKAAPSTSAETWDPFEEMDNLKSGPFNAHLAALLETADWRFI